MKFLLKLESKNTFFFEKRGFFLPCCGIWLSSPLNIPLMLLWLCAASYIALFSLERSRSWTSFCGVGAIFWEKDWGGPLIFWDTTRYDSGDWFRPDDVRWGDRIWPLLFCGLHRHCHDIQHVHTPKLYQFKDFSPLQARKNPIQLLFLKKKYSFLREMRDWSRTLKALF